MSANMQSVSWPGWETVRLIGRGSFGSVYEIQRDILGNIEKAAMKVISIPQNAGDIDEMYSNGHDKESITNTFKFHLKSIVEEYSMMRRLSDCPNIVACDDVRYIQHDDGIGWDIYIKMELLTPLLKSLQGDVSEETVVKLAKDICAALVSCKQHNIIHRDIKPQNIFCTSGGIYKLGDFGIAKTVEKTIGGTKIGTYNYMAPEVYHNRPYSATSDIYSLGMVLYWMLNERRMPFLPLPPEKMSVGMEETARNRRLSGERFGEPKNGSKKLKAIIMKACAYHVEDRYSSAAEMLMDLSRLDDKNATLLAGADMTSYASGNPAHTMAGEYETVGLYATQSAKKQYEYTNASNPDVYSEEVPMVMVKAGDSDLNRDAIKGSDSRNYADRPKETSAPTRNKMLLPIVVGTVAICFAAAVLFLLFRHTHTWADATCLTPRTCSECNETEGSELGHQIMAATCDTPEQCTRCGETFAKALGHSWMEATCERPETCSNCGAVTGERVHQWDEATYLQPMTCQLCGATEGSRLIPDPVYINELDFCDKYGKLWTMSMQSPDFKVHTDISSAEDYRDYKIQGHTQGPVSDYLGNRYKYGLHVDGDELANFYISYDIGGIYSTFSGVVSLSEEMIYDYRSAPYSKYFEVYGDGELLFTSPEMSKGCEPQEFSVDITGVEILTILYPQTQGPSRIAAIYDGKLS